MRTLPWEYGIRNLARSPGRLLLGIGGATLVVLLVIAAAAFVRGMGASLQGSADTRNVILLGAGSMDSAERSEVKSGAAGVAAANIPGIKRRLGVSYVSPEIHMATMVGLQPDTRTGTGAGTAAEEPRFVNLRGVRPEAFLVHGSVRIVEGRPPGVGELLVGRLAAARMGVPDARLRVGRSLWFDDQEWVISGRFEAPGTVMEAEIWTRLGDLQVAANHENLSCVVLTLDAGGDFADADLFTKQRLDLELVALREVDYYSKVWAFYGPVRAMVWITALLVAIGAFFGGLNTLYASFAARVRELGTLQALGYPRGAVLLSLVQESLLTSVAGALLASVAGLVFLDGLAVKISMGAFGLTVDATAIALGLGAGLLLGLAGAIPPAWRCLRLPVAQSLKSA